MEKLVSHVITSFSEIWSTHPTIVAAAPGRVNLIGEHTDYTGGFVLPVAIDRQIVVAVQEVHGDSIIGYSIDFGEEASCKIGEYDPRHQSGWFRYALGVLSELEKIEIQAVGFRFAIGGNVPIGSGLSSSAAFEMAVLTALEGLMDFHLEDREAALLCQRAENNFVGMNCGIMDQYISKTGRKDHAILIDCSDLSVRAINILTPGYSWLVVDSNKRRGLVDSEYNKRRRECEEGVVYAQSAFPERTIRGLRDITVDDLSTLQKTCDNTVLKRVKHVVTENDRVLQTVKALDTGDIDTIGKNLYASHRSLRDDFEVSCEELDMLVDILSEVDGVSGARLTGAGFGGCVIAFLKDNSIKAAENAISKNYSPMSLPDGKNSAEIWPIKISDGAKRLM
ncbi:galactokinase [Candidatus Latescibacterota bacterium]